MKLYDIPRSFQPLVFVLFLAAGIFGYLLPAVGYFSSIPGDVGDARLNSVLLEHVYRWIMRRDPSLWSPPFFYPFEGTLAFSDNHFGSVASYVIFRWLGLEREPAFDAWFSVGVCLNYLASGFALRRLGFSALGAAVGAFVFAFSMPTMSHQDVHAQLLYRYAMPLAVLGLFRALESRRLFHVWQAFFWTAVQFYCSIYLGVFLAYLLLAMMASLFFFREGRSRLMQTLLSVSAESPRNRMMLAAVAVLSTAAVGWLLYRYQIVSREYGLSRSPAEIASMLPRLGSYLFADRSWLYNLLHPWVGSRLGEAPMHHWPEHQMFPGFIVLCLAACGAIAACVKEQHEFPGRVALAALALLFFATLYVNGHSFYFLLMKIPGIMAIRAVSRIILAMMLPLAILAAIGAERIGRLAASHNQGTSAMLVAGLALLLGAEIATYDPYNVPISDWSGRAVMLKKQLPASLPDHPILYVSQPSEEMDHLAELDGMIVAQDLGIPTLNGFSGSAPPGFVKPESCAYWFRLLSYLEFHNLPQERLAEMGNHVVQLGPETCRRAAPFRSNDVISSMQARSIQIDMGGIDLANRRFSVAIGNRSPLIFNPFSTRGQVRLSWRFVALNAAGAAVSDPGWDLRTDLRFPLRPNESMAETVTTDFPTVPGLYRLKVSLVQETIAWFHEIGMPVGRMNFTVDSQ